MPLTDKQIRAAQPREKDYKLSDGMGVYLLVTKKGYKYWRMKYRFEKKEKLLALGVYPEVSLKGVRAKAAEAKSLIAEGVDPSAEKQRQQSAAPAASFQELAWEWFNIKSVDLADKTIVRTKGLLNNWILPAIGKLTATEVKPLDILQVIQLAEAQGKNEVAHRIRETCSQIFRFGIITQACTTDPARDLIGALVKNKTTHFASLTEPDAVAQLMLLISEYEGTVTVKTALRCSAYWFARPVEVRSLEWADVDFDQGLITIPGSRMKMGNDHIIPMCRQSIELLRDLYPITGRSRYVFPSARGNSRCMSENAVRLAIRAIGYTKEEMSAHGFRAMARTLLDEVLNFRVEWIEHQLAHEVRDVNGRAYNRTSFLAQRKEMMQAWADYLDDLQDKKAQGIKISRTYGALATG